MASVKIVIHNEGIADLLESQGIKAELRQVAEKVLAEAEATAQDAQNGPDGTIAGYAEAGFSIEYDTEGRNQFLIVSNAPKDVALAAHFNSQRKNGIGHLRAALYKFATTTRVKTWPIGQKYKWAAPKNKGK